MTERPRLASNLVPFSFLCDRFVPGGYTRGLGFEQRLDAVAAVEGIDGAVMGWPCPVDDPTVLKKMLADRGLALSALEPDIYSDARFKHGSLSSRDPGIRRESIERIKATIDAAAEAGAHDINLWLAQDGFDYVFEAHYADAWKWLTDSALSSAGAAPVVVQPGHDAPADAGYSSHRTSPSSSPFQSSRTASSGMQLSSGPIHLNSSMLAQAAGRILSSMTQRSSIFKRKDVLPFSNAMFCTLVKLSSSSPVGRLWTVNVTPSTRSNHTMSRSSIGERAVYRVRRCRLRCVVIE